MAGIIGYGTYIPKYRIKLSEIAEMWQKDPDEITTGLQVTEKSVPAGDEDIVTIAIEAGRRACKMAEIDPSLIGAVYVGSENHPYAVNPSSTIVADYLGIGPNYFTADMEFACKAGTAAMQNVVGLVNSKAIISGMAICSDIGKGKPRDVLEYTAASAGAAYVIGSEKTQYLAEITQMVSFASDHPDFWRRDGTEYPTHFGRFSGEPGYFMHVFSAGEKLLKRSGLQPKDFAYCVFHMPNGKFPRVIAKKLGFTNPQLAPSLTVEDIGNPYTASALLGLAAVLDIAKPYEKIFFVSYGSGAGSDGFIFETTANLQKKQKQTLPVAQQIKDKIYISYSEYLKHMHVI